jgi:hypothetical protein
MTQAHESRLAGALLVLTAATGLIDAVSYLALGHVFTANMTGNVVFLARSHDHRPHVDPHGARGGFATRGRYQSAGCRTVSSRVEQWCIAGLE